MRRLFHEQCLNLEDVLIWRDHVDGKVITESVALHLAFPDGKLARLAVEFERSIERGSAAENLWLLLVQAVLNYRQKIKNPSVVA
jgi:hypothetical protein